MQLLKKNLPAHKSKYFLLAEWCNLCFISGELQKRRMNWIMELQADLILVGLQVEFKEATIKAKSCSHVSLFVLCKQEYSTTNVVTVKSIREVLRLYDTASQDGFNPDIHFI